MTYHMIDMDTYVRRAHFEYFRSLPYPYAGTTVETDVTEILKYSKAEKRSFYLTFLHAAALAADIVPEFRQRIRGNGIIEYDECPSSHIELLPDRSYCYCTLRHHMGIREYYEQAESARKACVNGGITEDQDVESMYFISTVPWFHYTSVIQPAAGGDESNPRITWGKFEEDGAGRMKMPVSVLVHHSLVDGFQIAQFYKNLEELTRDFGALP